MVLTIRLGRGALMRARKSPKTELVGCYVWRLVFFLTGTIDTYCVCGLTNPRHKVSGREGRYSGQVCPDSDPRGKVSNANCIHL
jgi:hypothetical protein